MFDQRKRNQDLYEGAMAQAAYEGEQKGLNQGLQEGARQKTREIVLNMLTKGIDIATISDLTGIPMEEVSVLAQSYLV